MKKYQFCVPLFLLSLLLTGCGDSKKTATEQYWNAVRGSFVNYNETVNLSLAKAKSSPDPVVQLQDFVVESKNILQACDTFVKNLKELSARNVDESLVEQKEELALLFQRMRQGFQKQQNLYNEMYQLNLDFQNLAKQPLNGAKSDGDNWEAQNNLLSEKIKRFNQLPAEGEKIQAEFMALEQQTSQLSQKLEQVRVALNQKYQFELIPFHDEPAGDKAAASVAASRDTDSCRK